MGRGLFDYAEMNPTTAETPREGHSGADSIDAYYSRQAAIDRSKQLMDAIEGQLQQGTRPQYVLYTALHLISLLTGAEDWERRQRAILDATYKDLAQESMFGDNVAKAEARLDDQRAQYIDKTRRKLKRIKHETGVIYGLIQTVQEHLEALEKEEELPIENQRINNTNGHALIQIDYWREKEKERRKQENLI